MISTRFVLMAKDESFYKSESKRAGMSFDEARVFSSKSDAEKTKNKLDNFYGETTYTIKPVQLSL